MKTMIPLQVDLYCILRYIIYCLLIEENKARKLGPWKTVGFSDVDY